MSLLSRLFGAGEPPAPQFEPYEGMQIHPQPQKDGGKYRLAARITHDVDGTVKEHHLIRADTFESHHEAVQASIAKAKQMIDEQGTRLFN